MQIRDRFDGRASPFEGDRELVLRRLPANSRVVSARATVTPVGTGSPPFAENIAFTGGQGEWGATLTARQRWVEVDFHARRTLAAVTGANLQGAALLVDPGGGVFTDVNERGALGGSRNDLFRLQDASPHSLPGLAVSRFRLTAEVGRPDNPAVTSVTVLGLPSNVRLSLGEEPPFFTHAGELSRAVTTPDFGKQLQSFLAEAAVENGFYVLPLTVHSDSIARLEVALEVDVVLQAGVLPEGLDEVALAFDHGSLPRTEPENLRLALPANARVRAVRGRASGAFAASQVVLGPTGEVDAPETAEVSAGATQAQLLALDEALAADGVDLLLAAASRTARLEVDLLEDLDGKPGGASFLPAPVAVALDRETAGRPTWTSVALPSEIQLRPKGETRYWLAVRSVEGEAVWAASAADAEAPAMQETRDGGLSWRRSGRAARAAFFRLRRKTGRFRVPVDLQVGAGAAAERVSLQRFAPMGRVDLRFDVPEVAAGFNRYVEKAAPRACSESEHLANGDFREGLGGGPFFLSHAGTSGAQTVPAEWALTAGVVSPRFNNEPGVVLGVFDSDLDAPTALSQVVPLAPSCAYEFSFSAWATHDDATAEVHWLGDGCGLLRSDVVAIGRRSELPALHRARLAAPAAATEAEVRFLVPDGAVELEWVSLRGTANAVENGDLQARTDDLPAGWQPESNGAAASLVQTVMAPGDRPFTFEIQGREATAEVRWLRDDGSETGTPTALVLAADGFECVAAEGRTPADAVAARVKLSAPTGREAEIRNVDLRFPELTSVPATFVAEAPGDLKVLDWQVEWEPVEVPPPPLPETGLCPPTPPDAKPGELADGCCCCPCCGAKKKLAHAEPRVTAAGRAVRVGHCADCGGRVVAFGGRPVAGAPRLGDADLPPARIVVREEARPPAEPVPPLTRITGIGEKRAELLAAAGLGTLDALSRADPAELLEALPRVSEEMAEEFVAAAREILAKMRRT